jgi:hypothetical protein
MLSPENSASHHGASTMHCEDAPAGTMDRRKELLIRMLDLPLS